MANPQHAKGDYSRAAVPEDATVSGWRVALIKLGIVIALPGFVMGAQIGAALGLGRAALAVTIGGVILTVIGALTGMVAAKSRLSTSLITQFAFGRAGGRVANLILSVTLLGWFGVTAQIFAESLQGVLAELGLVVWPYQIYVLLGGGLMAVTTVFGFAALQRLADFAIPLLLIVVLMAVHRSLQAHPLNELLARGGGQGGLAVGISAVVGGLAASVTIFPDLCRFARTTGDVRLASALTFSLGMPSILILAAIISIATGKKDLIPILTTLGLGIPALLVLVFKAWATNSGNLYSASLGFATLFRSVPQPLVVLGGGAVGVALAALGITTYFIPFLLVLSIAIPPLAGIYVTDFFLLRGQHYDLDQLEREPPVSYPALGAWLVGVGIAAATSQKLFTLTGLPAADSTLISCALYFLFERHFAGRRPGRASA